jgi:hypothetical protein
MKQYLEERIAYLKNIEREKLNEIDNVPLGSLRVTQWDLIKEIRARKNELQNAVRWLETEQLNKPVVMQAASDGAEEAAVGNSAAGKGVSGGCSHRDTITESDGYEYCADCGDEIAWH